LAPARGPRAEAPSARARSYPIFLPPLVTSFSCCKSSVTRQLNFFLPFAALRLPFFPPILVFTPGFGYARCSTSEHIHLPRFLWLGRSQPSLPHAIIGFGVCSAPDRPVSHNERAREQFLRKDLGFRSLVSAPNLFLSPPAWLFTIALRPTRAAHIRFIELHSALVVHCCVCGL
jgi:hypothetical protein